MQTCVIDDLYPIHMRPVVHMSREYIYIVLLHILRIVGMATGMVTMAKKSHTICDACRLCHLIRSILKPVFHQLQQTNLLYLQVTKVPRSLDLMIW